MNFFLLLNSSSRSFLCSRCLAVLPPFLLANCQGASNIIGFTLNGGTVFDFLFFRVVVAIGAIVYRDPGEPPGSRVPGLPMVLHD